MLVCPVTNSINFKKEIEVFLPEGNWYNWEDMKLTKGGTYTLTAKMEEIPVFIKAGSITPLDYKGKTALLLTPEENINGSFVFYDDDGVSNNHKKGEYTEIKYDLEGFTLKASVLNGKLADEITLLVPANCPVKSSGWANDGKYKVKTVKLTDTIEL
jgi:alpha-glucosidase (family GH31 glycosyl hydrolase)